MITVSGPKGKKQKFKTSPSGVARAAKATRAMAAKSGGTAVASLKPDGRERVIVCTRKRGAARKGRRHMRAVDCKFVGSYLPKKKASSYSNKRTKGRKGNRRVKARRYKSTGRRGARLRKSRGRRY